MNTVRPFPAVEPKGRYGTAPARIGAATRPGARALPGTCSGGCGAGPAAAARAVRAVGGGTPTGSAHSSTDLLSIPDNGSAVGSPITAGGHSGNAPSTLPAGVGIARPWRGAPVVDLMAPDGSVHAPKSAASRASRTTCGPPAR